MHKGVIAGVESLLKCLNTTPPPPHTHPVAEVAMGVRKGEEALAAEVQEAGRLIRRFEMEAKMGPWVNWIPLPVREIIMPVK